MSTGVDSKCPPRWTRPVRHRAAGSWTSPEVGDCWRAATVGFVARYTLGEAIAPCWHDALVRMGMPADPSPQQVVVWQASRRAAPAPRDEVLKAIARRAAGETVAAIAADLGVDASNLRSRLTTAVPTLLTPWLTDVPAWRLGREQGRSTTELASLYEVPEHLLVLALDGWPDPDGLDPDLAEQVLRLWRAGAEVEDIATGLDVPVSRLRRWITDGTLDLSPARLRPTQLVERFGWSPHLVTLYRQRGVLPSPDGVRRGRDGHSVPWWWEDTITRLEQITLIHTCEVCGARLATAKGLASHRTLTHRDTPASKSPEGSASAHPAQHGRVS